MRDETNSALNWDLDSYLEELERSNRELDAFVADVAHDLQVPLRAVQGYCQLLQEQAGAALDTPSRTLLKGAIDAVGRMQQLIDASRRYARATAEEQTSEQVHCEAALAAALKNLEAPITESGATVTHGPLPTVLGQGKQLIQLFQNLIANAIEYRGKQTPRVHIRAEATDGTWTLEVRDNGIGIEPKQFERIFHMFQRLSTEGSDRHDGVGLAICRKVVERHGGRIWVQSTPGHGSRFCFTLLRSQNPPRAASRG